MSIEFGYNIKSFKNKRKRRKQQSAELETLGKIYSVRFYKIMNLRVIERISLFPCQSLQIYIYESSHMVS